MFISSKNLFVVVDIIWFPFIVTVYIKPKIWSSSLSSDFRIIYTNDKRGERDCFHLGLELWQSEFPENKLYKIFPVLKECISCPRKKRKNRKEEPVMARLHIAHSFLTHSFLLKGEELPMCIGCDKHLTIEHILLVWILLK